MGRVTGKIAVVTGGSSGLGRGCSLRLAQEGAKVIVADIQDDLGAGVVQEIKDAGGQARYERLDVTDELAWQSLMDIVKEEFGALHILVNNAGIAIAGSIVDMTLEDWQQQQAVNLDGVFLGVKYSIPLMRESGGASIINMSSVAGLKGAANLSAYNATKGGVRLFTKGVALECANNRWPIRVNSVHPGIIETPIWTKINPGAFEAGENEAGENALDPQALAEVAVPMGEVGFPADIANGVLFLASDEARYITGTELVIDGGISA